jgi:hypothetical protein
MDFMWDNWRDIVTGFVMISMAGATAATQTDDLLLIGIAMGSTLMGLLKRSPQDVLRAKKGTLGTPVPEPSAE